MTPFAYLRHGREPRTVVILILVYSGLAALIILFGASLWIIAPLALVTLPALYDLWADPSSGLALDNTHLRWHSGRREGEIALDEIDKMRFDTRWDFSVRVTAELTGGAKVRLPHECLPPHRELEVAFTGRGITVERHHFSVF